MKILGWVCWFPLLCGLYFCPAVKDSCASSPVLVGGKSCMTSVKKGSATVSEPSDLEIGAEAF